MTTRLMQAADSMYDQHFTHFHLISHVSLDCLSQLVTVSDVIVCVQLPSAVITLLPNISTTTAGSSSAGQPVIRFYTTGLLVLLPFPDMSMPFNVVAFTSTVLAFFFGSLFNLTYSTTADIVARSQQTPISRIKKRLTALLGNCRLQAKVLDGAVGDGVIATAKAGEEETKEAERTNDSADQTAAMSADIDNFTSASSMSTRRLRKVKTET